MEFLTNEKLTIVGAAGMIGSNMAQTAMMMRLTPNICLYDPFAPALEGVAEELYHCGFEGVNLTFTSDIKEALTGASYIVSSGGAARKAGMTREDLLKGNAEIAAQFGKDVHQYCPNVKHIVVIFNPADITGLITLLYSGLYTGCPGQHASAKRTGEILPYPGFRHSELPYVWWSWRTNGCIRIYNQNKRRAFDRFHRHYPSSIGRLGSTESTCHPGW